MRVRRVQSPANDPEVRETRRRFSVCVQAGLSAADASRIANDFDEELPTSRAEPVQLPLNSYTEPVLNPKEEMPPQQPRERQPELTQQPPIAQQPPSAGVAKANAVLDLLGPDWEDMAWPDMQRIAVQVSPRKVNNRNQAINAIRAALAERGT